MKAEQVVYSLEQQIDLYIDARDGEYMLRMTQIELDYLFGEVFPAAGRTNYSDKLRETREEWQERVGKRGYKPGVRKMPPNRGLVNNTNKPSKKEKMFTLLLTPEEVKYLFLDVFHEALTYLLHQPGEFINAMAADMTEAVWSSPVYPNRRGWIEEIKQEGQSLGLYADEYSDASKV